MLTFFAFSLLATVLASVLVDLPWSWDIVPLWADFGTNNASLLSEYQSEFVGDKYNIISLEKCLGDPDKSGVPTEDAFYKVAKSIRTYSSNSNLKIIFYWNVNYCICDCYNCTQTFSNNESMWWKNDSGDPIYSGGDTRRPAIDQTQEYVRQWWVDTAVNVLNTSLNMGIEVNGIFADGLCHNWGSQVSTSRNNEYYLATQQLMTLATQELRKLNPNMFIVADGVSTDPNPFDYCINSVPYVDGVLMERFGAFEEVDENGNIYTSDILLTIDLVKNITSQNKAVLVKSWVGPETTPITNMGPSWPPGYEYPTPTTHTQIQNYSSLLITFPLSIYLCALVNDFVYLSYSWWWDLSEGYCPCPNDPSSCDCPLNWYKEFENKLGKPLNNGTFNGYLCNRQFEHANVSVNISDDSSGIIYWF